MKKISKSFRVRGRDYRVVWRKLSNDDHGLCDPPDRKQPKIKINPSLTGKNLMQTMIHELLHASFWDIDEPAIQETARDIANVLWSYGFRSPD